MRPAGAMAAGALSLLPLATSAAGAPVPRALLEQGCGACHEIPGVRGAHGRTGPPLGDFRRRAYIAGRLPNGRDALVRWLLDPPAVKPGTAMPDLGLDPATADAIAGWLLRPP